uniref:Uncharacterized protein n=1 Tax=Setaria italica TaxID=4555 RepID=K3YW34_SETIT
MELPVPETTTMMEAKVGAGVIPTAAASAAVAAAYGGPIPLLGIAGNHSCSTRRAQPHLGSARQPRSHPCPGPGTRPTMPPIILVAPPVAATPPEAMPSSPSATRSSPRKRRRFTPGPLAAAGRWVPDESARASMVNAMTVFIGAAAAAVMVHIDSGKYVEEGWFSLGLLPPFLDP